MAYMAWDLSGLTQLERTRHLHAFKRLLQTSIAERSRSVRGMRKGFVCEGLPS
jgi:hypothetical protein